jgi:O-antigen/teichoic acid export membrane protein
MMPVLTIASASAALITPAVAKLGAEGGDKQRARRKQLQLIRSEAHRVVLLGVCGAVLLAVAAPMLVPFLLGDAFEPAVVLIWILLVGYVARAYCAVVAAGAAGLRVARIAGVAEAAALVVTVTMLPFLLPRLEAVGAAITSTCAYVVTAVVAFYMYRRLERADRGDPPPAAAPDPPQVLIPQSVDV